MGEIADLTIALRSSAAKLLRVQTLEQALRLYVSERQRSPIHQKDGSNSRRGATLRTS